jgi:hemerythrin
VESPIVWGHAVLPNCSFEWTAECSVGNETLDEQHQTFFRICKALHELSANPVASTEALHVLIDEIARYTRTHFHTEEYFLKKFGYEDLEAHRREHFSFLESLADNLHLVMSGEIGATEMSQLVGTWLRDHVMNSDMKYKAIFIGADT